MAVRRESVEIQVNSNLAAVAARDAAAVKLLANTLDSASKSGTESERSSQRVATGLSRSSAAAGAATPKLSSLAAAQTRLAVAERQSADAAGQVRVAEARLAEVRESGKAKASQVAAAEESLAKSRRNLESATTRATSASLALAAANDEADRSVRRADTSINQLTGRLRVAADVAAILGPALVPLGGAALVGVAGLANQLGFAAAAGGTAIIAFQGVGDAVGALNKYALEPTTENLMAAEVELARLSPAAAQFARQISSMREEWLGLRDAAASGLFPELTGALDEADVVFDRAERVLGAIGSAVGEMLADGLDSLGTDRWAEFTSFLESEAKPVMSDLGHITGSFTHGLAELWMATQPLNRNFSTWLVDGAAGFDAWAAGLDRTEGFANFLDYMRDNGPAAAETASAIGTALVDITQAVAPLGGPSLRILEAVANVFSAIADSPIGTPLFTAAAGFAALNRGLAVAGRISAFDVKATALGRTMIGTRSAASSLSNDLGLVGLTARKSAGDVDKARSRLTGYAGTAGKAGLAAAGLTLATTDLGAGLLDTSTASGAMIGSIGGLRGGVIGAAIGAVLDLRSANADLEQSMDNVAAAAAAGDVDAEIENWSKAMDTLREQGQLHDDFFGSPADWFGQILDGDLINGAIAGLSDFVGYGVSDARDDLAAFNQEWHETANQGGIGDLLSAPFDRASNSIEGATNSTLDFIDAQSQLDSLVAKGGALVAYEAAMDDLNATLRENGNTFNANTEAGRANITALNRSAQAAFDYAAQLKGADRIQFLKNTRDRLRQVAQDFPAAGRLVTQFNRKLLEATGRPYKLRIDSSGVRLAEGQARQLKRQYDGLPKDIRTYFETYGVPATRSEMRAVAKAAGLTPKQITTVMTLQNAAARLGLRDINQLLSATDRFVARPGVNANTGAAQNAFERILGLQRSVDGNNTSSTHTHTNITINEVVNRSRQAAGGGVPRAYGGPVLGRGTDRSDNILTPTSPGEWVHQAPAVRHYGPSAMDAINKMLIPREALRTTVSSTISPALKMPQRSNTDFVMAASQRQSDAIRHGNAHYAQQTRQAMERQGVQAAMRAGGGGAGRVSVSIDGPLKVTGKLNTPWGPADIEGIAERVADERIEAYAEADDDYSRSMAKRVPA